MVTIKDGCGCGTASCCSWKEKLEEAYKRATASVNKIGDDAGSVYFPDGTGYVKLPLPTRAQVAQIQTNADDIATLKQRATASEGDIDTLEQDVVRIDAKDTAQDQNIKDNSDRITSTNTDLVATEATVATHDSDIITLKANNQALAKSLVSDVLMTDGTTAGSVQVSIERVDGALITSANYKWGRDIGVRLEAGTQAGYLKTVIDLSDGTTITSNEYKIVEVLESDVYVTAITLVPDMTAGKIGGNISYSNGTTQTINAVNVPTAPGVTSAIEALQGRMTAVENTNNTQASEITALTNRVQAIEDTPGVGQFAAGKLGTIAGSAADGRVAAENDGTGSVNGWTDLKSRVTTAEGQIVTAQNDIAGIDTKISGIMTDISGLESSKVSVAQGAANAGKALVIGADGNVAPGDVSGGEVWEEIDYSNPPTDWANGDRIKMMFDLYSTSIESAGYGYSYSNFAEGVIYGDNALLYFNKSQGNVYSSYSIIRFVLNRVSFNLTQLNNGYLNAYLFNAQLNTGTMSVSEISEKNLEIRIRDMPTYQVVNIQRIRLWRIKSNS